MTNDVQQIRSAPAIDLQEHFGKKKLFFVLAAAQAVLLLCILLFCSIKYEVSDDFIMEMVVSGAYTGHPDAHMMFSNIFIGWLFVPLYSLFPAISWYFWLQMLLCFLSFLALTYVLVQKLRLGTAVLTVVWITAFAARDLYILPQFTKTAIVASMCGCLLFVWALFEQNRRKCCVLGALLAITGCLVRRDAFFMAIAFSSVLVVYHIVICFKQKQMKLYEFFLKIAVPGIVFIVTIFLFNIVNALTYTANPDYTEYYTFTKIRSQILDYTWCDYENLRDELTAIGVSENDYQMILHWDFADQAVFSTEKMQQVLDIINAHRVNLHPSIREALSMIRLRQLYYPMTLCCVLLGLFCAITNPKKFWVPAVLALMVLGFLVYFYRLGRWVYRVEFGFLFCAAVLIAYFCEPFFKRSKATEALLCAAALLVGGWQGINYLPDNTAPIEDAVAYRMYVDGTFYYSASYSPEKYTKTVIPGKLRPEFLAQVNETPEDLYVLDFGTAIQTLYYDFSVFKSSRACFPKNVLFLSGVTQSHPSVQDYIESLGFENTLAALPSKNVYYVSNTSSETRILTFFHEHGQSDMQVTACGTFDDYTLWKYTETVN